LNTNRQGIKRTIDQALAVFKKNAVADETTENTPSSTSNLLVSPPPTKKARQQEQESPAAAGGEEEDLNGKIAEVNTGCPTKKITF
jgi:hypothetical protein